MIISIDGASRRNGKPDCLSAGGVFIKTEDNRTRVMAGFEKFSTNQRGELQALQVVLSEMHEINPGKEDVVLVTDSEYLYNSVFKDWVGNWAGKGWVTADGSPVKNQDLWKNIHELLQRREDEGYIITIYHVKGHLMSLGKVTARDILLHDPTGKLLYETLWNKYEEAEMKKPDNFEKARGTFRRNHDFDLPDDIFKEFVVCNVVADYVAGTYIDRIDAEWIR